MLNTFQTASKSFLFLLAVVFSSEITQAAQIVPLEEPKIRLFKAIKTGDLESVEEIIFADLNLINSLDNPNGKNTSLHLAARNGQLDIVDFLLAEGASINEQNRYKKTPLHEAVANKRDLVVERLLRHWEVNPNIQDNEENTPLHIAIESQNLACILSLLDHDNLDPSIKNKWGKTPDELLNSQASSAKQNLHPGAKAIKDAMEPFANIKVKDILKKQIEFTEELKELANKIRSNNKMMFLSYCWNRKHSTVPMVDDFESCLKTMGLVDHYLRDKRETEGFGMTPGVSIKGFMDKARDSHGVIIFLNEEYLKSWNCMYEFWQVWDVEKRQPKPTATIIRHPDCTNIFGQTGHAEYTKYWSQALLELENKQDDFSILNKGSHVEAAKEADKLKRNMEPIVGWLAGHILSDYWIMRQKGFKEVLQNVAEPGVEIAAEESHVRQAIKQLGDLERREKENRDRIETINKGLQDVKEIHDKNEKDKQDIRKQIEDLKESLKPNEGGNEVTKKANEETRKAIAELTGHFQLLVDKDKQYGVKAEELKREQETFQKEKTTLDIALSEVKTQFANIEQERKKLQEEREQEEENKINSDVQQVFEVQNQFTSLKTDVEKQLQEFNAKLTTTQETTDTRILKEAMASLEVKVTGAFAKSQEELATLRQRMEQERQEALKQEALKKEKREKVKAEKLVQTNLLESLQSKTASLEGKAMETFAKSQKSQEELAALKQRMEQERQEALKQEALKKEKRERKEKEKQASAQLLLDLQSKIASLSLEKENLKKQIEPTQKKVDEVRANLKAHETKRQDMEKALATANQNIVSLKNPLEATQKKVDEVGASLKAHETKRQDIEKALAQLNQTIESLKKQLVEGDSGLYRQIAKLMCITIPPEAQGYEEIYLRFLKGALIYRPQQGSDAGMITLPIRDLSNPLEGTFDLSRCGEWGNYLSISTGYRKVKKAENANKVEIWFAPRFLIEKELNTTAKHFQAIFPTKWNVNAPVGIFWTTGGWDDLTWYDYLTTQSMDEVSNNDLFKKWNGQKDGCTAQVMERPGALSFAQKFHVHFIN